MSQIIFSKELTATPPKADWLLPHVLPRNSMVCMAGGEGTGKSILSYAMLLAVAYGTPFLGYPVKKGRVLYFDEENSQPDILTYFYWLWAGMGRPDLAVLDDTIRFEHFSLGARDDPFSHIGACVETHQPDFVVIDTATSAWSIDEENDNSEALRAIKRMRRIKQEHAPTSTWLILKHAKKGKDGKMTVRGAKGWVGATDATMALSNDAGSLPRAMKDEGWTRTVLTKIKVRAWGLRHPTGINPLKDGDSLTLSRCEPCIKPRKTKRKPKSTT